MFHDKNIKLAHGTKDARDDGVRVTISDVRFFINLTRIRKNAIYKQRATEVAGSISENSFP